jgi:transcriptional regulator with XRE-family HTH domain
MSRRARLRPADVGLPDTARRRTPGLRREEVAQLAGLSTEWYTLFEMAKDTGVSQRTLDAVSTALKLTPAEQKHLYQLATGTLPAIAPDQTVDPTLRDVLDGYHTGPAMLLNVRMDVVAANPLAVAIFGDLAAAPDFQQNWLWYLYENHHMIGEWESQARELTATFRASLCEHANDPAYSRLLNKLLETSETFRRFWAEHDVGELEDVPPLTMTHPTYGPLRFTMRVLAQPGATNAFYCCFLVPDEPTTNAPAYRDLRRSLEP